MKNSKHKTFKKSKYNDEYDDEEISYRDIHNENKNKRRLKRLNNALKTKNIDELMQVEDEDY